MTKKSAFLAIFLLTIFDSMLKYQYVCQQANINRQQAAVLRRTARIVRHQNYVLLVLGTPKSIICQARQGFEHLNFCNLDLFRI